MQLYNYYNHSASNRVVFNMKVVIILFFIIIMIKTAKAAQFFPAVALPTNFCPPIDHEAVISRIRNDIEHRILVNIKCGDGEWYRVAYLDMSDSSQQCPSTWREYGTGNIRVCGRANRIVGSCSSISFRTIAGPYSRVCGRVIGYQVASPDGFGKYIGNDNINFDGINITHGLQRNHIWSYVAGVTESSQSQREFICPCSTVAGSRPPSFIEDHFYCESGNPIDTFVDGYLYSNDPLWDGQQCEGTCCDGANSPPWFSVQLPAPTTDAIEVSICGDESTTNEDTPISLLELYVQ